MAFESFNRIRILRATGGVLGARFRGPRRSGFQRSSPVTAFILLVLPGLLLALAGCNLAPYAYLPYPETVYAPHPHRLDTGLGEAKLREMYTASPNRDPDGLGALQTIERNSQMTLMVEQMMIDREQRNLTAYSRTDAAHERILNDHKEFFRDNVLFHGILLSAFPEGVIPDWYLPEGIYLVDDKGRKFLPRKVEKLPENSYIPQVRVSEFGGLDIGYPRLVFPGEAITGETRAVTLFFANIQRRAAFTWVFDESYSPGRHRESREHGKGFNRMWRIR